MKTRQRILSAILSAGLIVSTLIASPTLAAVESNIYGDLNGDGKVNSNDAVYLSRYLAKWDVASSIDLRAADLNQDGDVGSADAVILARWLAKWTQEGCIVGENIGHTVDHPVLPVDHAAIAITSPAVLEKGTAQALTFDFTVEEAPEKVVYTYRSSNGDVIDVAADGTDKGIMTAKAVGVATVSVTAWMYDAKGETSNVTKSYDVTVSDSSEKLVFGAGTSIRYAVNSAQKSAEFLKSALADKGTDATVTDQAAQKEIVLSRGDIDGISVDGLRDEGYIIKVVGEKLYVVAYHSDGLDAGVRYLAKYYLSDAGELSVAKSTDVTFEKGEHIKNLTIAGNPISDYEIVIPDTSTPSLKNAADTFRRYVVLTTGYSLLTKNKSEATEGKKHIEFIVDPTAQIAKNEDGTNKITPTGFHVVESYGELKRAGYLIEVSDTGDVLITGGADAGDLYGAFEFAEEFFGLRFLDSGIHYYNAENTDVPAGLKHKEVPTFDYRYVPNLKNMSESEDYYLAPRKLNATENQRVNNARYGDAVGTMFWHAHSFYQQITEYWEQKDPSRGTLNSVYGDDIYGTQPCLTNEQNYEECIRNVKAEIERRLKNYVPGEPGMQQLTIAWNDNENYCQCGGRHGGCRKVNDEEGSGSGTLVRFVNRVAEWLESEYPAMDVFTIAYGSQVRKPTVTPLRDNVVLCYCWNGCNNHIFDGSQCSPSGTGGYKYQFQNIDESNYFQGWSEKCSNLYTWYYSTNYFAYLAPLATTYNLHYDLFWWAENGCDGVYAESQYGNDTRGLEKAHNYLLANLEWDPYMTTENYQALLEEYYRMTYGDGWHYLLEYMDMWIEAGDQLGCWLSNFSQPQEVLSVKYYGENYKKMYELFDKAEALANTEEQQILIQKTRFHVTFLALCARYEAEFENGTPEQKAAYTAEYEAFYNSMKALGFKISGSDTVTLPDTSEITANPMMMFYGINTLEPRWK